MSPQSSSIQAFIDQLVQVTGASTPEDAIRVSAKQLVAQYVALFGQLDIPIDVAALASLRDIRESNDLPVLSDDAELAPDGRGGVEMRVNPDRPETRKRFSIAHEISHTFFPEYQMKEWCRTDARFRDRSDPSQYLEMLCDIGAAELLLPEPWFSDDAASVQCASDLSNLALKYHASREATLRRYAELSSQEIAAVFFVWKLKPSQEGVVDNKYQTNLLGLTPEQQLRDALALRIDYSIASTAFRKTNLYLPPDKSVRSGPIIDASRTASCIDGESFLELGEASGHYSIMAIPVPTAIPDRGPCGEYNVAAIVKPLATRTRKAKTRSSNTHFPSLFD
jgi:hypothetical protein